MTNRILSFLPDALLPWYFENKRDLPWRNDQEPYHIWLSEIMLQQTRVEAVRGYYTRFLHAIPSIEALANADDELLHKLWEGLGYYTRIRNMKKAACTIMQSFDGVFPEDYASVRSLSGIGDYTAGAICSIAFNQKRPAVDGNVLRIYSRLLNDSEPIDSAAVKRRAQTELTSVYPEQAGAFTQALMELGATVCGPNKKPDCVNCPCNTFCLAYQKGTADVLPVRLPKRERREEDMTVWILRCDDQYALEKRSKQGLLAGLWQFPNAPGHLSLDDVIQLLQDKNIVVTDVTRQSEKKHIFTHIQWNMRAFYLTVQAPAGEYCWLSEETIQHEYALPTAFRMFWEDR